MDQLGHPEDSQTLRDVLEELRAARKTPEGLSVEVMSRSPRMNQLLGNGDAAVALNALKQLILTTEPTVALGATTASLGLSSNGRTHLARLAEFGYEHGYDQRQVRRYSDVGIRHLARLICTSWVTVAVPQLDVFAVQTSDSELECRVTCRHQESVTMRTVAMIHRFNNTSSELTPELISVRDGFWERRHFAPVVLSMTNEESLTIVWRGELWPKFAVRWVGEFTRTSVMAESVGNKLMIYINPL